ncbi:MAG: LTA synthase family protein [Synergistes sp.]|nr:LTA synthase family protein [Synergistes sp.]
MMNGKLGTQNKDNGTITDSVITLRAEIFFALAALSVSLKFFAVDFAVSDTLQWLWEDWFGIGFPPSVSDFMRGCSAFVPSFATAALVIFSAIALPRRLRLAAVLTINFLLSLLAAADIYYIRAYSDIFSWQDIRSANQLYDITASIFSLFRPWDILFFADTATAAVLAVCGRLSVTFRRTDTKRSAALLALLLIIQCALFAYSGGNKYFSSMYNRLALSMRMGAAYCHAREAAKLTREALAPKNAPTDKEINEISSWLAARRDNSGMKTQAKNIIFIQCEALQSFVVDMKIAGVPVTPNLNRFIRESLYFPNTWEQVAIGVSSDAEFMANTGLYPAREGAAYVRFADNDYATVARAVKERGGNAYVFQGTNASFWNCRRMYPKLFFDKQYSQESSPHGDRLGLGLTDGAIFAKALQTLKKSKDPFFAFVLTLSGHHPYDYEGIPRDTLPLPSDMRDTIDGNYLLAMHYFDTELGKFIEGLRREGLLDTSLIVLYGDHSATGLKNIPLPKNAGSFKRMCTKKVPLVFRTKETAAAPRVILRNVGQTDIAPTAAAMTGLDMPITFGNNLLSDKSRQFIVFRSGNFISDNTFVEPQLKRARDIKTGAKVNFAQFDTDAAKARQSLRYNDMILKFNLVEKILSAQSAKERDKDVKSPNGKRP